MKTTDTTTTTAAQGQNVREWTASEIPSDAKAHDLEFQDNKGDWQHFTILITPARILFGGCCNIGFIESGYIEREEFEHVDETLCELLADLETYYNDGPQYVSRIVFNERM